jgi:hypothetical protein
LDWKFDLNIPESGDVLHYNLWLSVATSTVMLFAKAPCTMRQFINPPLDAVSIPNAAFAGGMAVQVKIIAHDADNVRARKGDRHR